MFSNVWKINKTTKVVKIHKPPINGVGFVCIFLLFGKSRIFNVNAIFSLK